MEVAISEKICQAKINVQLTNQENFINLFLKYINNQTIFLITMQK